MENSRQYKAPWGVMLIGLTVFSLSIVMGIFIMGFVTGPSGNLLWIGSMIVIPGIFIFVMPFFMIRGFVITGNTLLVKRLGWNSRINLNGLVSVYYDPTAMKGSIRTLGNGGFFAFCGKYRNRKLGPYRAFVTHLKKLVVLQFSDCAVVISPDDPENFVTEIKRTRGL